MNWKEIVKAYFHFTARDRIALLVISSILGFVLAFPFLSSRFQTKNVIPLTDSAWISALNSLKMDSGGPQSVSNNNPSGHRFVENPDLKLFPFDPNNTTPGDWKKLGLRDRTIQTIQNYLLKGGKFRKAEDLKKIYGLRTEDFSRLERFIRIPEYDKISNDYSHSKSPDWSFSKTRKPLNLEKVDIGIADSATLVDLPGIGNVLASRIVRFREKLGGFYSIDQIRETFGLSDSVYQLIHPFLELTNSVIQTLNINTATVEQLNQHPYLRYKIANAIVMYRMQHGSFQKLEDLMKLALINEDLFQKLRHYLTI